MPKDYEQIARDRSAAQRDTLRKLLGEGVTIHVDIHGVATVRADMLISALCGDYVWDHAEEAD